MLLCWQIEKEAQTWLDSDSDEEEGEKKPEEKAETKMEEAAAAASAECSEPQPGTSQQAEEMERSPMEFLRTDESEMEELEGAVGGSD